MSLRLRSRQTSDGGSSGPAFVVGDVHGHRDRLIQLLRDAGLVDRAERWTGGDARLLLLGDLTDRGPDGLATIDLVRALQAQGSVECLLGNHEVILLGTHRFGRQPLGRIGESFHDIWLANGGVPADLAGLDAERIAWLETRPAVLRYGDWLVVHADTDRYLELGRSVERVNAAARAVLASDDVEAFERLLGQTSARYAFEDPRRLRSVLRRLGGRRVVHGHTPIFLVRGVLAEDVIEEYVYADGAAVNADHCLFAGGPGFVVEL